MNTFSLEADTRILIDKSLENLGWKLLGKEQNVFFERPRTDVERKKLGGKRADYVLYTEKSDKPLIIIEAKRKGENISKALEQGIDYAKTLEATLVYATDGLFCKSYHAKFDRTPLLNGEEIDEFIRENLALQYLTNWDVNTISEKVRTSRKDLIKIFNEANNMLRSEGLRAGIERFSEFANILFLKLISENEVMKEEKNGKFSLDSEYRWDYIKELRPNVRIEYINDTVYKKINEVYRDNNIFDKLIIKNPKTLSRILEKLDPLTLTDINSDVKGDAFEYFLKESTATGNDLGEYFTPRHIVKTMVKLANPQIGEKIYDPFCGTGGLLIESFRHIWNTMPRNPNTEKILREETIYGNEITNTSRITKMNMILAGDGHSNIRMQDSLANPIEGGYDVVLTNMPYSQKTDFANLYDIKTNNGDSICVQHCMKAINSNSENGRMAVVVPEGFLFRKDLAKTREFLLDNCNLQSIISLPQGVFLPYAGVKTNILYATRVNQKHIKKRDNYWYFEVKNDGYTLDNYRRRLEGENDLDNFQEYRILDDDQSKNMLAVGFKKIPIEKVKNNNFVLAGSRYNEYFISSSYNTEPFKNFATFSRGVTYKKDDEVLFETKNKILTADNITLTYDLSIKKIVFLNEDLDIGNEKRLNKNDIFICTSSGSKSHIGKVAFIKNNTDYYAGGFMGIIRTNNEKCLSKYLYFLLRSNQFKREIKYLTAGSNINNISNNIVNINFPLLPIATQKQIIKELENYQNIAKNAMNIINSYKPFIKLDKNHSYIMLKDIAEIIAGQSPESKYYNIKEEGLPFYQGKTEFGEIFLNQPSRWTKNYPKIAEKKDILLSVRAPVGPVNLTPFKICIGRGLAAIRLKNIGFNPLFVFYFLKTIEEEIQSLGGGSTFGCITKDQIEKIKIPKLSIKAQNQIVTQIKEEQKLIGSSKDIIKVFLEKLQKRIDELFA